MRVPIISHSHDGIRVNIDGVADVFGNAVQLAESYARHKARCQTLEEAVRPRVEMLSRSFGRSDFDNSDPAHCKQLATAAQELIEVLLPLMEHCRR